MAILKYISAESVNEADKYHLYKNDSGITPDTINKDNLIATQSKLLDFLHYGAIGMSGKMIEKETGIFYQYNSEGTGNSVLGRPLRRITEDGIRYCVGVSAWVTLNYGGAVNSPAFLSGEYDGLTDESFTIHGLPYGGFSKEADGWYLSMQIKQGNAENFSTIKIHMFDLDDNIKLVDFGKGQTTVFVHYVEYNDNHRHTEYIPIDLLGDAWTPFSTITSGVCVGAFDLSADDYDYPKMAFYDENLKFVGGANSKWLSDWIKNYTGINVDNRYFYTDNSKYWFTKEAVEDIAIAARDEYGQGNYIKPPKFVVFSSRINRTSDKDHVSVPNVYFPLFAMKDKLETARAYYLFVTADSSSAFFTESPASNVEPYYVPEG